MTLTYVQAIDMALENVTDEDVITKLTALKTSLEKKAGATSASNSKRKAETQARKYLDKKQEHRSVGLKDLEGEKAANAE